MSCDNVIVTPSPEEPLGKPSEKLRACALEAFLEENARRKAQCLAQAEPHAAQLSVDARFSVSHSPGRPCKPELVHPARVPSRGVGTSNGRGLLIHALAHIEFNAINLALDAVLRFANMPEAYYRDWWTVACEEALHFRLLCDRLAFYGLSYGDCSAHDGLWQMAEKTSDSVLARMALVPRLMEARGLDVSPAIRDRLAKNGDQDSADVLDIILRDEVGHVEVGNRWFAYLCEQAQCEPMATYEKLTHEYGAPWPRPPFNRQARLAAGFTPAELEWLETLVK